MAFYEDYFHVRFLDVDNNNLLKPTSLANYFQEIGGEHSNSVGFGLYDSPRIGLAWVLLGWSIKINRLPKWNDDVRVITWHKETDNGLFFYRDFEAYVGEELIAVASSKWVACDIHTGSISKISETTVSDFQTETKTALECDFKKIKEPENVDSTFKYTVLRHDLDTNNHMNNAKYINLAFEAIPESIYGKPVSYIEVMYRNSTTLGEEVVCRYSKVSETEHIVTIKDKSLEKLHAIVKLVI